MTKAALVDDSGMHSGGVECADSEHTRGSVGRDVQEANTLRDGIRVDGGRKKAHGTGMRR